jgi:hypothetical protein
VPYSAERKLPHCYLIFEKTLVEIQMERLGILVHIYNPSTLEIEAGSSGI